MTEDELQEAAGLVARFYSADAHGNHRYSFEERMRCQRRLLVLGVKLNRPLGVPDPRAPEGGSTAALKVA